MVQTKSESAFSLHNDSPFDFEVQRYDYSANKLRCKSDYLHFTYI